MFYLPSSLSGIIGSSAKADPGDTGFDKVKSVLNSFRPWPEPFATLNKFSITQVRRAYPKLYRYVDDTFPDTDVATTWSVLTDKSSYDALEAAYPRYVREVKELMSAPLDVDNEPSLPDQRDAGDFYPLAIKVGFVAALLGIGTWAWNHRSTAVQGWEKYKPFD